MKARSVDQITASEVRLFGTTDSRQQHPCPFPQRPQVTDWQRLVRKLDQTNCLKTENMVPRNSSPARLVTVSIDQLSYTRRRLFLEPSNLGSCDGGLHQRGDNCQHLLWELRGDVNYRVFKTLSGQGRSERGDRVVGIVAILLGQRAEVQVVATGCVEGTPRKSTWLKVTFLLSFHD